jgi:hypothetical protein
LTEDFQFNAYDPFGWLVGFESHPNTSDLIWFEYDLSGEGQSVWPSISKEESC